MIGTPLVRLPGAWPAGPDVRSPECHDRNAERPDPPACHTIRRCCQEVDNLLKRAGGRVQRALVWNNIYRTTSYLRSALWTIPILSILVVLLVAPGLRVLDSWLGWRLSGLGISGAQALYQTTITLTLSFLVFTFGSLLVAIQVAGGQLTPRIIATTLLRDNVVRYSVGLFVFTLVFAVMALNRLDKTVFEIVSLLTAILGDRLHGDVSLPHRLCGTPAAAGQHPLPGRRRGRKSHYGCLH